MRALRAKRWLGSIFYRASSIKHRASFPYESIKHRPNGTRQVRSNGADLVGPCRAPQGPARHQRPAGRLHQRSNAALGQEGARRRLRGRPSLRGHGGNGGTGDGNRRRRGSAGGGETASPGIRTASGLPTHNGGGIRGRKPEAFRRRHVLGAPGACTGTGFHRPSLLASRRKRWGS